MLARRVTIIVGHFGSGKTEIALNAALTLAADGGRVALVDLDVVKPYFRSRATRALMAERGVAVVAPGGENVFADLPILVPQIRSLLRDSACSVLLDVGGDDTGARALGSLADVIPAAETEHLLVLNFRRPFTESVESAAAMAREIEAAARLPLTGLVSNTHLMGETTPEVVLEGYRAACQTGDLLGLPVVAVVADEGLAGLPPEGELGCRVLRLRRLIRPPFEQPRVHRTVGPLFAVS